MTEALPTMAVEQPATGAAGANTGQLIAASPDRGLRLWPVRAGDDSMAPTLGTGDMAVVDAFANAIAGEGMYLIHDGLAACLARLTPVGAGRVRVSYDNRAYHGCEIDADRLCVLGRVVALVKPLVAGFTCRVHECLTERRGGE